MIAITTSNSASVKPLAPFTAFPSPSPPKGGSNPTIPVSQNGL